MNAHETALALHERGFWPIVEDAYTKRPRVRDWGTTRWEPSNVNNEFSFHPTSGVAVGVGPGRAPGNRWLIDVEVDDPVDGPQRGAESLAALFGGEVPRTMGWQSQRGPHALFTVDGPRLLEALANAGARSGHLDALPGVEFKTSRERDDGTATQCKTTVPPTKHGGGKARAWNGCFTVAEFPESAYLWLEARAKPRPAPSAGIYPTHGPLADDALDDPDVMEEVNDWLARRVRALRAAPPGGRHAQFFTSALQCFWCLFSLRDIDDLEDPDDPSDMTKDVIDQLRDAAESVGQHASQIDSTLENAWQAAVGKTEAGRWELSPRTRRAMKTRAARLEAGLDPDTGASVVPRAPALTEDEAAGLAADLAKMTACLARQPGGSEPEAADHGGAVEAATESVEAPRQPDDAAAKAANKKEAAKAAKAARAEAKKQRTAAGLQVGKAGGVVVDDFTRADDPVLLAEVYLSGRRHEATGESMLRRQNGQWLEWTGGAWADASDEAIQGDIMVMLAGEFRRQNTLIGDRDKWRKPTRSVVGDVALAASKRARLADSITTPSWLSGEAPFPAHETLPMRNGLVHIASVAEGNPVVADPTPRFFSRYVLDYDFETDAPAPTRWLQFLESVWGEDRQSVELLQEWFGYVLTEDNSQQTMLMLVGAQGAGKGTIGRILTALIGGANVEGPSLNTLATNFGLAALIGKPLAVIGDARLSGRADQAVILERLLSISGGDRLSVDRKHQPAWSGTLPTRLMLLANELPRLSDTAAAIMRRLKILRFTQSFVGKEDRAMEPAILANELPGVLLWAIEGWKRLKERGHFIQPDSGKELASAMQELASPVRAFVDARCEVGEGFSAEVDDVYAAWKRWCDLAGRDHPGDSAGFGRQLRAAVPTLQKRRPRADGARIHIYDGLRLVASPW